jgi:c-di-GMP-binding flagellar brake protein YcgR
MSTNKVDNIENIEHYMLYSRSAIVQKLRQLGKKNSLITIHFDGLSMLSTVIDVLSERDLLVLDYGADEALNQKLIKNNKAVIKADYDGIISQFTVHDIQKARLLGNETFACALPEEMLWVQRRESYRVKVPLSEKVICEVNHSNNNYVRYPVLDISQGGIALFDANDELELEPGNIFENCKLSLGKHNTSYIDLEIRNHIDINPHDASKGTRCGCAFLNISGAFESSLQKFINMVEMQQKRTV